MLVSGRPTSRGRVCRTANRAPGDVRRQDALAGAPTIAVVRRSSWSAGFIVPRPADETRRAGRLTTRPKRAVQPEVAPFRGSASWARKSGALARAWLRRRSAISQHSGIDRWPARGRCRPRRRVASALPRALPRFAMSRAVPSRAADASNRAARRRVYGLRQKGLSACPSSQGRGRARGPPLSVPCGVPVVAAGPGSGRVTGSECPAYLLLTALRRPPPSAPSTAVAARPAAPTAGPGRPPAASAGPPIGRCPAFRAAWRLSGPHDACTAGRRQRIVALRANRKLVVTRGRPFCRHAARRVRPERSSSAGVAGRLAHVSR